MSGPMKELLEAEAVKWFGNDIQYSELLGADGKIMTECFNTMAENMRESVLLAGHTPIAGTEKVIQADANPLNQFGTIALKLRAAFTSEPAQFVAYCGYKMDEARRSVESLMATNTRLRLILAKHNIPEWEEDEA